MSEITFQLGAEVQLFKTDLVGMVDSESGWIIVRQPKAGVEAPGITIQEFIEEIKGVFDKFLGKDKIPDIKLPPTVQKITKGINIYLKEIFMLIKTKESKVDFAIWVSMDTSDELQEMFRITIKSGYLKVWNTENDVIRDEMEIGLIEKLLKPEAPPKQIPEESAEKK